MSSRLVVEVYRVGDQQVQLLVVEHRPVAGDERRTDVCRVALGRAEAFSLASQLLDALGRMER